MRAHPAQGALPRCLSGLVWKIPHFILSARSMSMRAGACADKSPVTSPDVPYAARWRGDAFAVHENRWRQPGSASCVAVIAKRALGFVGHAAHVSAGRDDLAGGLNLVCLLWLRIERGGRFASLITARPRIWWPIFSLVDDGRNLRLAAEFGFQHQARAPRRRRC